VATIVPLVLVGVNDAWQLEVVALTLASVHGLPEIVAVAVPVFVNATVPSGADAVPAADESFTKAVQVVACPVLTIVGEQVTAVVVVRRLTVTVFPAVGPLPL